MAKQEDRPTADLSQWKAPANFIKDGVTYPEHPCTPEAIDKIKEGDVPPLDVLVATYPRSGTSRLVEICWMLTHGCEPGNNDIILPQPDRHLFLDFEMFAPRMKTVLPPVIAKTHFSFKTCRKLVERTPKVIVGIRNPKDALVSFYHYSRMNVRLGCFPGNWRQFMQLYRKGQIPYGDYFDSVLSWWSEKERENVMIVRYEDLNERPLEIITAMSKFLDQDHSEEKLLALVDWTKFSNMRVQPSTNYTGRRYEHLLKADISPYMRKGIVGDWKNYFNAEENSYIDHLCETRCAPANLQFVFD